MEHETQREDVPQFPKRRPEIAIQPASVEPFPVDCRELRWWFAVPEVGERGAAAWYDPPEWHLSSVQTRECLRTARVHGLDCVELAVDEWPIAEDSTRGPANWRMYGRLTEDKVQWLATYRLLEGKRILHTFLDEGFAEDWGEDPRRLEDRGAFKRQQNGSYGWAQLEEHSGGTGAGVFRVDVAERAFTCLRVFDIGQEPAEHDTLAEAYLNRDGRTVLFRRYNGRLWAVGSGGGYDGPPWDERFPGHARVVINGVVYVHWYDCLTDIACGIPRAADRHAAEE
jgi:hypothetical protein